MRRRFAEVFCQRNKQIVDENSANAEITKEIKTKRKKIFDQSSLKKVEISISNETESVYLNTNIWGESTDCWRCLREYLSKDNNYFKIEPIQTSTIQSL